MSSVNMSDLMPIMENVRPLPQGRDTKIVASAVKGEVPCENFRKFESELSRCCDNATERAKIWLKYLNWFEQTQIYDTQGALKLYKRAFNDVVAEKSLDGSNEVVTIAYRLSLLSKEAMLSRNPSSIFDDMYSKRKCLRNPNFWIKWASLKEGCSGDNQTARKILNKALKCSWGEDVESKELIKTALKNLEERMCCDAILDAESGGGGTHSGRNNSNDENEVRKQMGQLESTSTSQVPVDRVSAIVASTGLPESHVKQQQAPKNVTTSLFIKKEAHGDETFLGATIDGDVVINRERENNIPCSKWKNENLKRKTSCVTTRSELATYNNHEAKTKLVIPSDDTVTNSELLDEMMKSQKLILDKLEKLDQIESRLSAVEELVKSVNSRTQCLSLFQQQSVSFSSAENNVDAESVKDDGDTKRPRRSVLSALSNIDGNCDGANATAAADNCESGPEPLPPMTPLISILESRMQQKSQFTPCSPRDWAPHDCSGVDPLEVIDEDVVDE